MSLDNKTANKFNIKDYQELIDTLAKVEYKKLSAKHLIDFSELVNIGTQVVHKLCANNPPDKYNKSYISTAIKWAIRNEVRRRYKWYVLKNQKEAFDRVETIRRAIASSSFGIRGINKPLKLTVSGAVTEQKRSDGSAIEVLLRADKALQKSYRFAQNITTKA